MRFDGVSLLLVTGLAACATGGPMPDDAARDADASVPFTDVPVLQDAMDVPGDRAMTADADVTVPDDAMDVPDGAHPDVQTDVPTDRPGTPTTVRFQDGVSPTAAYAGTSDVYLSQTSPTANFGSGTEIVVDGDVPVGTMVQRVSLVKWNVSTIPAHSVVTAAQIAFTVGNTGNAGTVNAFPMYGVLRPWTEAIATWTYPVATVAWTTPGADGPGTDREAASIGAVGPLPSGTMSVNLNATGLALVQRWVDDPTQNDGVEISSSTMGDGLALVAREGTPATARPRLTVTYLH